MTQAKLKLAKELNSKIKKHKNKRIKLKKSFDEVVFIYQNDKSKILIEVNKKFTKFPLKDFMKYLEHKITKLDKKIKKTEQKFFQL